MRRPTGSVATGPPTCSSPPTPSARDDSSAQSIAFAYAPGPRPQVMAENAPLFLTAPPPFGDGVRVTAVMERAVLEADGVDALVLRYGWFYGLAPTSAATARMEAELAELATRISGGTPLTCLKSIAGATSEAAVGGARRLSS